MSVKKEMLATISLLEKGIAENITNAIKSPIVSENCEREIERAKKEEKDKEVRENIIRVHSEQIVENAKNAERSLEMARTFQVMRQAIIDSEFPGIIGAIRVFFKI